VNPFFEQAEPFIAKGAVSAAAPLLEKGLELMPADWKPRVEHPDRLEVAFWDKADFMAYIAHAKPTKKVVWVLPSYSRACYHVGFAAVERHDLASAERWIDRGLALETDHPLLLCEKGLIVGQSKRREEALGFYLRATTAFPWNASWTARAHRGLGFELVELRQLDAAEAEFRRSLELEPGNKVANHELTVIADLRTGVAKGTASGLTRGGGEDEARKN
jgi:tetratricopeptide (TPR) repeat protein